MKTYMIQLISKHMQKLQLAIPTSLLLIHPDHHALILSALILQALDIIERTTSEVRLSQFYNTIDVLAHAVGSTANVILRLSCGRLHAHRKPVISHYGTTFQWPYGNHTE